MLRITPVYGSRWCSKGQAEEPECTLVEFSGCRVLWNVGWWASPSFAAVLESSSSSALEGGTADIAPSEKQFPEIPEHDCLILTDSTLQAAGGLPMYYQAMQERYGSGEQQTANMPPIYATYPTVKMGQMTLYDQHAAISYDGGRPPFSLQDLDNAFAAIQSIKYSQSVTVRDSTTTTNLPALAVTAHRAGHVVGGAFYTLQRLLDETVVVLTSPYHMARELHLDSSTLLRHASTPDVLVTHPGGPALRQAKALYNNMTASTTTTAAAAAPVLVTQAERHLTEAVLAVLRRDGHVLLPADAAGRVLELVLLLQQEWETQRLEGTYNLCWLGPMVHNTAEFARAQLEWMATKLGHDFDRGRQHPWKLGAVQFCSSVAELMAYMEEEQNPTCVVASGLSLEAGPARDVLVQWADNPDNAIIFTDSSQCYLRHDEVELVPSSSALSEEETMTNNNPLRSSSTTAAAENTTAAAAMAAAAAAEDEDDAGDAGLVGTAAPQVSEWTTAGQLLSAWTQAKAEDREMEDSITIDVRVPHRAPLAGAELKRFLESEEAARLQEQAEQEKRAMLREVEIAKGQLRLGEDETGTESKSTTTAVTVAARPRKKSRFDSSLFLKFSKPLHLTFEIREEAVGIAQPDSTAKYGIGESVGRSGEVLEDDYGIAVLPDRFIDIVSGVDPSKFSGGSGRIGDEMRRGFGFVVDGKQRQSAQSMGAGGAARVSEDEENNGQDEMNEQALEAVDLSEGNGIIRGRNGRPPTKVATVPRRLEVLAEVSFIPLEGRVDARAARQSVRALQPRQVVVLGGPAKGSIPKDLTDEVILLAEAARSFATGDQPVQTPSDGETAELNVGHAAYGVRLINTPYQTAEEKEAATEPPAPIEPFETTLGTCTISLLDSVATGQRVALDGSIVLAPRPLSSTTKDDPSVYLSNGEILLTDLRAELIAQGMKAEYSTRPGFAQLVVNGSVLVRKAQGEGRVHVEGPLCEDFYTVRSVVANQYATL